MSQCRLLNRQENSKITIRRRRWMCVFHRIGGCVHTLTVGRLMWRWKVFQLSLFACAYVAIGRWFVYSRCSISSSSKECLVCLHDHRSVDSAFIKLTFLSCSSLPNTTTNSHMLRIGHIYMGRSLCPFAGEEARTRPPTCKEKIDKRKPPTLNKKWINVNLREPRKSAQAMA